MASEADATVCMPWRPQPDRIAAQERVVGFWRHHGFPVIMADSPKTQPFHIGKARNRAVKASQNAIVIVADADTIPDLGAVLRAVQRVQDGVVIWPFDIYRHIPGDYVTSPDLASAPVNREYRSSVGGLFVTTTNTYWDLGGMDERLEPRWGWEDNCWHLAVTALAKADREIGTIYSFDHAADRDLSEDNPNYWRWMLYRSANLNPRLMRELIKR